jgi:hypothetical protein
LGKKKEELKMDGREKCVRCQEVDEDRRTLWMACCYEMDELEIPLDKQTLFSANLEDTELAKVTIGSVTVTCKGELTPRVLYTLRVCKKCRSEWMSAIQHWFTNIEPEGESPGTGIYIREKGHVKEITIEEWDERKR